jgi:hypothetical protein
MIPFKELDMRRTASQIINALEMRVARLEREALQVTHLTRQKNPILTKTLREISREMGCSLHNCHTLVTNEGFDSELDTRYYLVKASDLTSDRVMYFVVADQYGEQGLEDFGENARSVKRTFNQLLA